MMPGTAFCITMPHIGMRDGVQTIGRLFSDATRTEVAKHAAAQIVAERSNERRQKINRQGRRRCSTLWPRYLVNC